MPIIKYTLELLWTTNARLHTKGPVPTPIYINICTFAYFEKFNSHILTWLSICSWPLPLSRHRSLAWHLGGGLYNAIHDLICCIICCVRWIVVASVPRTDTAWKSPANELKEKKTEVSCITLVLQLGFFWGIIADSSVIATSNWPKQKTLPNGEYF